MTTRSAPAPVGASASLTRSSAATSARNSATWSAWEITLSTTSRPPGREHAHQLGPVAGVGGALGVEEHEVVRVVGAPPRASPRRPGRAARRAPASPARSRFARACSRALRLDLDRHHAAAGGARRLGQPHRRVAVRRADLEDPPRARRADQHAQQRAPCPARRCAAAPAGPPWRRRARARRDRARRAAPPATGPSPGKVTRRAAGRPRPRRAATAAAAGPCRAWSRRARRSAGRASRSSMRSSIASSARTSRARAPDAVGLVVQLERRQQPLLARVALGEAAGQHRVVVVGREAAVRVDAVLAGVVDERDEAQVAAAQPGGLGDRAQDVADVRADAALGMPGPRGAPGEALEQLGIGRERALERSLRPEARYQSLDRHAIRIGRMAPNLR